MTPLLLQATAEVVTTELPIYNITTALVILLVMLFLGAIAAGAEVSFFTLSVKDVNYLKTREDNGASGQLVQLVERPATLLSTLKASKAFCAIIIVGCTIYIVGLLLGGLDISHKKWLQAAIVLFLDFILILLVVELIPKVYARQHNIRMALFSTPIVNILFYLFKTFVPGRDEEESIFERELRRSSSGLSDEELEEAITSRLGKQVGSEEIDIFKGIMKFGNITVKQIMQPRMSISGIREQWSLAKLRQKALSVGYSRLPVYQGNIDHIIGMFYTKDLVGLTTLDEYDWHGLIRPVFFVHESKLIEDLFQEFQNKRLHAAIVVDEFGGTSGIVTLEDIMEQIVGEIRDEFDEDVLKYKKLNDYTFIFEGKMLINDMLRIMGLPADAFDTIRNDSSSVAGLVLEVAKRFPSIDDKVLIDNIQFTILGIEHLHIERIRVEILAQGEE